MNAMDSLDDEPDLGIVTSDLALPDPPWADPNPNPQRSPRAPSAQVQDNTGRSSVVPQRKRPVSKGTRFKRPQDSTMKPNVVVDEMFPEGAGPHVDDLDEVILDLAGIEKPVHADFFNQFDDLYDDEDLS